MSHIQIIKNHLELRSKHEAAIKDILSGKKDVQAAAISYGLNRTILILKIDIVKKKEKYIELKFKFKSAVSEYLDRGATMLKAIAKHYGINPTSLKKEIEFFKKKKILGAASYKYDKPIERAVIFTFRKEEFLLKDLYLWREIFQPYCFCQLCAMELLILTNQYIQNKGRMIKGWNKTKPAGIKGLIKFEMKFSKTISETFMPNCIKIPPVKNTLANKSNSPLLFVSKSVHDRSSLQTTNFDQSRIYNVEDMSVQTVQKITSAITENDQPMDLRICFSN
ncbi:uncharacterized protein [Anoplolepis gracilipes]|uniref:uncharacterized protein n=1 Tax=Anoplolepis gracilipes TaxID=354296 RepID=UPI003BA1DCD8